MLTAVGRALGPGKLACFVIGDTAVGGTVLRADEVAQRGAQGAGFVCRAIASQRRPQFHAESSRTFGAAARMEHVIVLERAAASAKGTSRPKRRTPRARGAGGARG